MAYPGVGISGYNTVLQNMQLQNQLFEPIFSFYFSRCELRQWVPLVHGRSLDTSFPLSPLHPHVLPTRLDATPLSAEQPA